jgi:hypothetical protein
MKIIKPDRSNQQMKHQNKLIKTLPVVKLDYKELSKKKTTKQYIFKLCFTDYEYKLTPKIAVRPSCN